MRRFAVVLGTMVAARPQRPLQVYTFAQPNASASARTNAANAANAARAACARCQLLPVPPDGRRRGLLAKVLRQETSIMHQVHPTGRRRELQAELWLQGMILIKRYR